MDHHTASYEQDAAGERLSKDFAAVTGLPGLLRWQTRLFVQHFERNELPTAVDIPTGLGKTAVMALWLIARARGIALPRRLVYVVDRRTVVDQATDFAIRLRENLDKPKALNLKVALGLNGQSLPISTLRGQHVDNRQWLEDPSLPAIIVGTVDMVGSRLLFEGYGVSRKMRPYHAGLLGADALVLLDEAHLVPPFEALLAGIAGAVDRLGPLATEDQTIVPRFRVLPLSATSRSPTGNDFRLEETDYLKADGSIDCEVTHRRLTAAKRLTKVETESGKLVEALVEQAWSIAFRTSPDGSKSAAGASRVIVFCDQRKDAEKVRDALNEKVESAAKRRAVAAETELLVGARRVRERQRAAERLAALGFIAGSSISRGIPAFLIATSAGEVGVDLDADHMVCDLVTWERMVQRLGRVNRRGDGSAEVVIVRTPAPGPKKAVEEALKKSERDRSKKDAKAISEYEKEVARHRSLEGPLMYLPTTSNVRDASPIALMRLGRYANDDATVQGVLRAATSAVPLRPALTRALVDAWSMTSLKEHTGRPEIEPWLRGWIDDEPQTTVLWRNHLPVRAEGQPPATASEVEAFFEAAPPHASEALETETFRVIDWLRARAIRLLGKVPAAEAPEAGEMGLMPETESAIDSTDANDGAEPVPASPVRPIKASTLVGLVLSAAGALECRLTVGDLASEDKNGKTALERTLPGRTLVLDARFGGLSNAGMLAETDGAPALAADQPFETWLDPIEGRPVVPFRVRAIVAGAEDDDGAASEWRPAHDFVLERGADGDVLRVLRVEKWRDQETDEDARSAGPPQTLAEHQSWAEARARTLARSLALPQRYEDMLTVAARLHDEGKKALRWQEAFNAPRSGGPYAKTRGPIRMGRLEGYRHEFGSLPYAERSPAINVLPPDLRDLALHLIAAHHGFGRPLIPTDGCDDAPPSVLEQRARDVALRFARLQERWGPWGLAWWEAMLRAADQQASRDNERRGGLTRGGN